jgi:hypothetical protein
MKTQKPIIVLVQILTFVALSTAAFAQQPAGESAGNAASTTAASDTEEKNIQEYIELLRTNVRQQKSEIMGAMMELDVDQAAKFWPIYSDYDAELTKLNKQRVANILEYAQSYDQLTDAKADELVQKAIDFRNERSALLEKYYGRVKSSLGSIEAARFLQVEDQLLLLIDLEIASSLPIAEQGS